MAVANCPACGGRIEFAIGSSAVVVCDYCHSVVARTDRGVEDLGKVAALIDTGSPLQRGTTGKYHGNGFRITGRTQMKHAAGGVWDEWYAAFDDGRWGWIAEAQGKFYVTFKTAATALPPKDQVRIGLHFGDMVIAEAGTATLISGEGEIPWTVIPGSRYDYADLSGPHGHFATIDYSEQPPLLFKGEGTTLPALGITPAGPPREKKVAAAKLSCSKCGGPLNLVAPDQAERIVCPNCGAVHDITEGNLVYLKTLQKQRAHVVIPLGRKGTIAGDEYAVAGYVSRSVTFDRKYFWSEYLLFNPAKGFRWLVDSDDHWSFVEPVPVGDVRDNTSNAQWDGKTFYRFQDAMATVEYVIGEFYWKVEVGEQARAIDYIAAPEGLTAEYSGIKGEQEVNWSHGSYMTVPEVEKTFGVSGLTHPSGVGWLQPNPYGSTGGLWARFVIALVVVAFAIAIIRSRHTDYDTNVPFGAIESANVPANAPADWTGSSGRGRVFFTPPFEISGNRNIAIEGTSGADNSWVYVGGDLINSKGQIVDSFQLPIEYYHGVDGGESWSEGSQTRDVYLSALPPGSYTMRLEADFDNKISVANVDVKVEEGLFRWSHFWLAFLLITIPAAWRGIHRAGFENQRWSDAMFTQAGAPRGSAATATDIVSNAVQSIVDNVSSDE